jgi:hypothetical protein
MKDSALWQHPPSLVPWFLAYHEITNNFLLSQFLHRKALPGFFLCIFSSLYLPEETCFQQAGSSEVEGTSQALLMPFSYT